MKPAEAQALRSVGDADYVMHGAENVASLPALICAAIHGNADAPARLAENALGQLSNDLTMLAEVFDGGTDLVPSIIQQHILSLAARAGAAAELSSRINEANKSGPQQ